MTVTLDFLAERVDRVLNEMAQMRDDMRVVAAVVMRPGRHRTSAGQQGRAEHARFDRLVARVGKLEEDSAK